MQILAITDHNTLAGYEHARKISSPLILIPGAEITATKQDNKHCHILALGIQELKKGVALSSVANVIDYIHEQGGIAIAAHPFRQRQNIDVSDAKIFDAIEDAYNSFA